MCKAWPVRQAGLESDSCRTSEGDWLRSKCRLKPLEGLKHSVCCPDSLFSVVTVCCAETWWGRVGPVRRVSE